MTIFRSAELLSPSVQTGDATSSHLFDVARILRQDGVQVGIYCNYPPGPTPADLRPLVRQVEYGDFQPQSDLLLLEYPTWCPLAERVRDAQGTVIFSYHGVTPPELWRASQGREWLEISQVRTQLVWFAHLALTVSPFMRQELHQHTGYPLERIRVVPWAVPLETYRQRPSEGVLNQLRTQWQLGDKRVILFIGRIAGNKRIDLAIEALARLRTTYPNTHLFVIGSKDNNPAEREISAQLVAQAEQLGIAKAVTLAGRVDAVEPYLALADVLILPSQHEGFGVPLVEAMAAGTPVVASASGAMPWVLDAERGEEQAAGLLAQPGDAADLARQIGRLLADETLRAGLIERGRARVEAFSTTAFEQNLRQALAEAAELAKEPTLAAQHSAGRLHEYADVALRSYRVRSGIPVVGPLIEWVRHNSTTHVKEAYLDPIIEQQVNYNRMLADEILRLQFELHRLQAEVEELRKR
jgi:glycosyltransferase involved in cell wall biosynthesis